VNTNFCLLGSVRRGEFLEKLSVCQFLKDFSVVELLSNAKVIKDYSFVIGKIHVHVQFFTTKWFSDRFYDIR
jgi:hypothetical protein